MSRRRRQVEREIYPDPKYHSKTLSLFINTIMQRGKKSLAEDIVYGALDIIAEKTKEENPLEIFLQALENVKPMVKVVSRRIGGSNYQIPMEVSAKNAQALAFRWIISFARKRSEKTMAERLAGELLAAHKKEGNSVRKREETHRMAEANKAFAHFRV
ncbi:MAG TPA: 30S ribosomal protein S7 [Candidatus Cloacimonas sp.]|jgi:small subunit ribosomal protein S7|nr:small subunit ribosomal protein [Candidatus Cloacimonadota bacterium]HCX73688.1 30S ribosomal protein S7 [Candidatus Cloacimonas sp.]